MDERAPELAVAIIGTGMIAEVHRRAIITSGSRVTAVLGSSPERSAEVAQRWGRDTSGYASLDELLASDVDVVHVTSPNGLHRDQAIAALRSGKHVVCEKPLGLSVPDAEAMADAARGSGLVATVPFAYRFHPLVREIRQRRLAGELGRSLLVHGTYLQDWMLSPLVSNWRVDPAAGGRSRAFADIGSHWCDLVEWVLGERLTSITALTSIAFPERAAATGESFTQTAEALDDTIPVTTEDIALLMGRTNRGTPVNLTVSQVSAGRKNRLWFELDGTEGSAVFDQEHSESIWLGDSEGARIMVRNPQAGSAEQRRLSLLPAGHAQGYQACFDAFVKDTYAAIGGSVPEGLPTFDDGARSARIVDALLTAVGEQHFTPVTSGKEQLDHVHA